MNRGIRIHSSSVVCAVNTVLCASRSYSSATICACRVTAGVRLCWDSRWLWCAVKTATNGKTGPELIPRVRVDGVVGVNTRFAKGRGNEYARPGKDPRKWGWKRSCCAKDGTSISGGCPRGDECGNPRGIPASEVSSGIRGVMRGPGRVLCYTCAGKHGVRKVGARRRTHWMAWLIRGPRWLLREKRHGHIL